MPDETGFDAAPMVMDAPHNGTAVQQTRTRHSAAMQVQKPRSLATTQRRLSEEAMLASERFFYGWGAGKDRIEGASVKCALAVARCYGNCSVELGPVQESADSWIFSAYFVDHETGFTLSRQFRQSKKSLVYGKHDEFRKDDIRFQIGQSKAIRNVVLNAVPIGLVDGAVEAAKSQVGVKIDNWIASLEKDKGSGKAGTGIVFAIDLMLKDLAKYGVTEPRVLAKLEIADRKAIDRERLIVLAANRAALADGETTADELFPMPEANANEELKKVQEKVAGNGNGEKKTDTAPPEEKPRTDLDAAIAAFTEAGGIPEELAERSQFALKAIKSSKGEAREKWATLFTTETQLLKGAK